MGDYACLCIYAIFIVGKVVISIFTHVASDLIRTCNPFIGFTSKSMLKFINQQITYPDCKFMCDCGLICIYTTCTSLGNSHCISISFACIETNLHTTAKCVLVHSGFHQILSVFKHFYHGEINQPFNERGPVTTYETRLFSSEIEITKSFTCYSLTNQHGNQLKLNYLIYNIINDFIFSTYELLTRAITQARLKT